MWEQLFIGILLLVILIGGMLALWSLTSHEKALAKRMESLTEQINNKETLKAIKNKYDIQHDSI